MIFQVSALKVIIVEVVEASLLLLQEVLHSMERLNVSIRYVTRQNTYFLFRYFKTESGNTKLERA